jgi:hypothetical protein
MNVPKCLSQDDNTCLLLKKTISDLVQSAREFYNKLLSTLKFMGFTENKSDPCLLSRCINGKVIMIGIYVDDCLVVGKENQVQEVIQGKGVTLSRSEAEYVAMSEAVKEVKFIYYLLRDIGIEVKLPIIVKTGNVGAMFMAQNSSSGVRTRHIDTRYHFVRENLDNRIIKIEFIKSVEN